MSALLRCEHCGKYVEDLGIHYGIKNTQSPIFCPGVAAAFDDDYWPYLDKTESSRKRRENQKKVKKENMYVGKPIAYSAKQLALKGI